MKNYILILSLWMLLFSNLIGSEFRDINYEKGNKPAYSATVIEEYTFDSKMTQITFSNETENDSGSLSLVTKTDRDANELTVFSFQNNIPTKIILKNENVHLISDNGSYYLTVLEKVLDRKKGQFDNKFRFYNKEGKLLFEKGMTISFLGLNENGQLFARSEDYKKTFLLNSNGQETTLPSLREFKENEYPVTRYSPFLSNNGLKACLVSPLFYDSPDIFPLGSRLFFFNDSLDILKTIDVEGKAPSSDFGISKSHDIILVKSYKELDNNDSYKIHIYQNGDEILNLDGMLRTYKFSQDENMLILNVMINGGGGGFYIVDINTKEVITKIKGFAKAISNKSSSTIAYFDSKTICI